MLFFAASESTKAGSSHGFSGNALTASFMQMPSLMTKWSESEPVMNVLIANWTS